MVAGNGGVAWSAVTLAATDAAPAQNMVGILEAAPVAENDALEAVNGNAAPAVMIKTNGGVDAPVALYAVDPTTLSTKPLPLTPSTAVGGLGLSSHPATVTFKVTVKGKLEFRLGPILAQSPFPLEPHLVAMGSTINKSRPKNFL